MSSATSVTISLALMPLFGFLLSRLLRLLRLPNVTAYILAGILLGPFGLGLIPQTVINGMDFLPDLALCFIAFSLWEGVDLFHDRIGREIDHALRRAAEAVGVVADQDPKRTLARF